MSSYIYLFNDMQGGEGRPRKEDPMRFLPRDLIPTEQRPLGYWLRVVENQLHDAMRGAFAEFGVTRREWRTLAILARGAATPAEIRAALPAKRRGGPGERPHGPRELRRGRPLDPAARRGGPRRSLEELLAELVERGWASIDGDRYALTAEGRRIHDELLHRVSTVRARVTAGIPEADYATTLATLERIAANTAPAEPEAR